MLGFKKPHFHHRAAKSNSVDPDFSDKHAPNPFNSDDELNKKSTLKPVQDSRTALFDDDEVKGSGYKVSYTSRNRYKNDFVDSGGIENQDVQELEHYAAYKAEETTKTVNSALKIAENMREDATKTMITLHQQGEQITRTHMTAADIEQDLSRGEKLLGSLGGIFSRTWKPKKGRAIKGPVTMRDDPAQRKGARLEQREKLGLTTGSTKGQQHSRTPLREPTNALEKVKYEQTKQDDALSDLSNILGELKEMAIDMGSEIEKHKDALNPLEDDVDELNTRVGGANQRARSLLGK
ncbi:SNAP25 homologous protein SNAP33-like [Bidens hawaiensis]|uniref:SNAP25 homologous protein SNAP33-like n=1 Tax=Bidens hawaiensis TaxID=980011 RepID=UPI00404B8712